MPLPHRVLVISNEPIYKKLCEKNGHQYKFYNYEIWHRDDDLISMYQRLNMVIAQYQPTVVVAGFKHKNCMNDNEKKMLGMYGKVMYPGKAVRHKLFL